MKTNNIFNFKRFGNYLLADGRSCFSNFGLDLLVYTLSGLGLYLLLGIFHLIGLFKFMAFNNVSSGIMFCIIMVAVFFTMGAKCWGHVTDRRAGSLYTLLPVSVLEKTLSIIIWSLLLPLAFILGYLGIDWVLSALDPAYGTSIATFCFGARHEFALLAQEASAEGLDIDFIANPFIYIDDLLGSVLIFVLGALVFKKNKVAKTILAVIAVCIVVSGLFGAMFSHWIFHMDEIMMTDPQRFSFFTDHLALWDTVSDQFVLIAVVVAIFFRIKTIKH